MNHPRTTWPHGRRSVAGAALLGLVLAAGGCDNLLEAENPNNIKQDDLEDPAAAPAVVNGALATLTRGINAILTPYSVATDELIFIGSRDAWLQIDFGFLDDPLNEFTDDAFKYIAEGRFMADEAIRLLTQFDANDQLEDRDNLARAYLYGAVAYVTIGDMFDEFAFSNRREPGEPITGVEMVRVYDQAIEYLNQGLEVARSTGNTELETVMLAMRARAFHARGVFGKVTPAIAADPLVAEAQAVADAREVLSRVEGDFKFVFNINNSDIAEVDGESTLFYNVNQRGELQIGTSLVELSSSDRKVIQGIALNDPITGAPDPVVRATVTEFISLRELGRITIVSAREMRLIIAEAALAQGDLATFTEQINALRAMNGLTPFSGQISPVELLIHERRVNLLLQGRRLADLYRFGLESPEWQDASTAAQQPGTFLPVTNVERTSNCFFLGTCGG